MTKKEKDLTSPYLTPAEVAILLKISLKTVYNYSKKGILKRRLCGVRKVLYLRSEVESAMIQID